jgi:hypothetical protein
MPPPKNEPKIPIPVIVPPMRIWSIESMFICLLRFRSVREEALFVLKRGYFNHAGEGYLAYLFELVERLHPAHHDREQIPFQILANVALEETIPGHETQAALLSQDETEKLVAMPSLHHAYVRPTGAWGLIYRSYHEVTDDDLSREYGYELLARFVRERGFFEPLRAAVLLDVSGSIAKLIEIWETYRPILERADTIGQDPFINLAQWPTATSPSKSSPPSSAGPTPS